MNTETGTLATVASNYEADLKTTGNCKWHTVVSFKYQDPSGGSEKEVE